MSLIEADDIHDVIRPFHIWSKFVGLTSFSFKRKDGVFVGFKTCLDYFCILLSTASVLAIGCGLAIDSNIFETSAYNTTNSFEKFSYFLMFAFFTFSNFSIWWIFLAQKSFCKILNDLRAVDEKLKQLKAPMDLEKHKRFVLMFVIVMKLLMLLFVYGTYTVELTLKFFEPSFLIYISMCFVTEVAFLIGFQFVLLVIAVKLRYKQINSCLKKVFFASNVGKDEGTEIITEAAKLHDKLVDVSEAINRCFGYPVSNFNLNRLPSFIQVISCRF